MSLVVLQNGSVTSQGRNVIIHKSINGDNNLISGISVCQQENKGGVCIQILPPTHRSTWIPTNGSIINLSLCSINCHPLLLLLVRLHCKLNQRTLSIITVPPSPSPFLSFSLPTKSIAIEGNNIVNLSEYLCAMQLQVLLLLLLLSSVSFYSSPVPTLFDAMTKRSPGIFSSIAAGNGTNNNDDDVPTIFPSEASTYHPYS